MRSLASPGKLRFRRSLAELRRHLSITQEDLAAALNVNQPAVSKLERADDRSLRRLRDAVKPLGGNSKLESESTACSFRWSCSNESRYNVPEQSPLEIRAQLGRRDQMGWATKLQHDPMVSK